MAITSFTVDALGGNAFQLNFASDLSDPIFYVYRDGELVASTPATDLVVSVADGAAPVFEVLDDENAAPQQGYPASVTLAWYAGTAVDHYLVQQFVAGQWVTVRTVADDGRVYYRWESSATLADSTTHQFRVVPVGTNGNSGTAATKLVVIARYPDPPGPLTYTYNGAATPTVTITQA